MYSVNIIWLPSTVRGLFWYCFLYHEVYPWRFDRVEEAREWRGRFIDWYNTVYRHSGIGFVILEKRRRGEDKILLEETESDPSGGVEVA